LKTWPDNDYTVMIRSFSAEIWNSWEGGRALRLSALALLRLGALSRFIDMWSCAFVDWSLYVARWYRTVRACDLWREESDEFVCGMYLFMGKCESYFFLKLDYFCVTNDGDGESFSKCQLFFFFYFVFNYCVFL
jgi:hypothetical protein